MGQCASLLDEIKTEAKPVIVEPVEVPIVEPVEVPTVKAINADEVQASIAKASFLPDDDDEMPELIAVTNDDKKFISVDDIEHTLDKILLDSKLENKLYNIYDDIEKGLSKAVSENDVKEDFGQEGLEDGHEDLNEANEDRHEDLNEANEDLNEANEDLKKKHEDGHEDGLNIRTISEKVSDEAYSVIGLFSGPMRRALWHRDT